MNRLRLIKTAYTALACLMLAACASDELTDGTVQDLPEGKYPLQIAGVSITAESNAEPWGADTPQTRMAEDKDGKCSWEGNEKITVQLSGAMADGTSYTATGEYTVAVDDQSSFDAVKGKELYWRSTNEGTITAWYCYPAAASDKTVDLSNQSNRLAYVLSTTPQTVQYGATDTQLAFSHQLAKVRVKLTGTKASAVTSVSVKGYTKCTVTEGVVSSSGTEGYISMKKPEGNSEYWEANVIPGTISTTDFVQLTDKNDATHICSVSGVSKLDKARYYVFNIEVKAKPIIGGETITEPGNYIMTGNITKTVTLNGDGINLTLDNVSSTAKHAIHVTGGSPVIIVRGTNKFSCSNTPVLLAPNANITINGATENPRDSKLTITTSANTVAGIGSAAGSNCGNIFIANVTLNVSGGAGSGQMFGGAAIGANGNAASSSSCGDITIKQSVVYAKGGTGASAIGLAVGADPQSCGEIKIIHSKIFATTTYEDFYCKNYAACIGHGAYAGTTPMNVGKITITTDESLSEFFSTDRFKAIDANKNTVTTGFYKVGKCTNSNYQSLQTWSGVYFGKEGEEKELASGSSNGYGYE